MYIYIDIDTPIYIYIYIYITYNNNKNNNDNMHLGNPSAGALAAPATFCMKSLDTCFRAGEKSDIIGILGAHDKSVPLRRNRWRGIGPRSLDNR